MISGSDNRDFKIQGFILIDCVDSYRDEDAEFYEHVLKIIKKFGTDTSRILENDPSRLEELSGIGPIRAERIANSWRDFRRDNG